MYRIVHSCLKKLRLHNIPSLLSARAAVRPPAASLSVSHAIFKDLHTPAMASPLDQVSEVDIDSGVFKYILIQVHHNPQGGQEVSKHIVRGYSSAEYHGDIYDQVTPGIEGKKLDCECMGGGRIRHELASKTIEVYGYSQGYGRADHSITVALLKKKYPDYTKITFSNDGY